MDRVDIRSSGNFTQATLTWQRDHVSESLYKNATHVAVHHARMLHLKASNALELAIRRHVSALVKQVYPTATALKYDGKENEDGLLHTYVREILDADGRILDSQEHPSDQWEELIDKDVEPLLWEVSERDQSYYGEGNTFELV